MTDKTLQTDSNIVKLINNINLSSQRLLLKKFSSSDIESNIQHEMKPEIMRYIRDPLSLEETRKKTEEVALDWKGNDQEWALIALRLNSTDEYIGMISFRYESIENDTVELGWRLDLKYFGNGYATEAASCILDFIKTEIKPHKMVAYCVSENTASSNIMKKLGMEYEACLRQYSQLGGKWHDEIIYGLILD